ncbi:MAG: ferredoxin [Sulfurovum sp.]|nr:MAG: ferredoxin [Sulfurovum sp.]
MALNFNLSSCVRVSSKASTCTKCIDICPVETIKLTSNLPSFTPSECINCGGCVGSCPTESFSLSDFNVIDFAFDYLNENKILSCKNNIPCLAIFGVEELISLALGAKNSLEVDIGGCQSCEIAQKLYPQILNNIEEANFILSTFSSKKIMAKDFFISDESETKVAKEIDRRAFLENFKLKNALKVKKEFESEVESNELKIFDIDNALIEAKKNKTIPNRRKLLFTLLKQEPKPLRYETILSEDINFISQKYISQGCDNCQICYRVCPTGAISATSNLSTINFDSMLCVKCHLCHDVCAKEVLKLQPTFEIQEFFQPQQRHLASFSIKRCHECGNQFSYFGGEIVCPRCRIEEDEAIFLHQNAKEMENKNATS